MSEIIIGKYRGQYLTLKGQQSVICAAPTRSNKGTALVIPNLLNFSDSVVCLDVKLENYKITSKYRAINGHEVYLWAPFSEDFRTHRWNPLDTISRDYRYRIGDVLAVGQILYPGDVDEKLKFWNDQARNLFMGIVLYLMETPELPCTLGEVLRQSSGKGKPVKKHFTDIMKARSNGPDALSDQCLDAFGRFVTAPDNTLGNIVSSFTSPLDSLANPIVDAATSASDFDIRLVRYKPMSIYLGVQPNRLPQASLLLNLFFALLIDLNTKTLPQNDPNMRYQCLMLKDEFAAMGYISGVARGNGYFAGYDLRSLTIIQSIGQVQDVYKTKTKAMVTNHAVQIIYPPKEQDDAEAYSKTLGFFTEVSTSRSRNASIGRAASVGESTSDQRRALMMPQELREMPQTQEIIVMENSKPILCDKAIYHHDHTFMDRLKSVSGSLLALEDDTPVKVLLKKAIGKRYFPTKEELEHIAFVRNELSSSVPTIDIDLHLAKLEKRTRELKPNEEIDLSKLATDFTDLPQLDDPSNPSKESVKNLVDTFFSMVDWEESNEDKVLDAIKKPTAKVKVLADNAVIEDESDGATSGGFDFDHVAENSAHTIVINGESHSVDEYGEIFLDESDIPESAFDSVDGEAPYDLAVLDK